MARPREFDEEQCLNAAVLTFWRRGFEATSVRELAANMGLTCASLYNAFGDKRALFHRALEHYMAHGFSARARRLEGQYPPREVLVVFFEEIIERSLSDADRKGCLLVNSALEVAPHDAEFRKAIETVLSEMEAFFRRCVCAGQADGTIARDQSPEDLGRLLLGALLGLRVLARSRPEPDLLHGLLRPVFSMLGVPEPLRGSRSADLPFRQ